MTRRRLLCALRSASPLLILALALGLVLALCLDGCSHDPSSPKQTQPTLSLVPRTSPENVLYDFRSIYAGADALIKTAADTLYWDGMYRSLFYPGPDTFKFYFIPADVPPEFPDGWWGLEPEAASFENMLRQKVRGTLDDIKLDWTIGKSEPDNRIGHTGWKHIYVSGILLDVVQGQMTYRVLNGTADFYFARDPADSTLWVITEWYDLPVMSGTPHAQAASAPEGSSWSRVKVLFLY